MQRHSICLLTLTFLACAATQAPPHDDGYAPVDSEGHRKTLARRDVADVLRANVQPLKDCAAQNGTTRWTERSLLTIRFTIVPDGSTTERAVVSEEGRGGKAESCILDVMAAMHFPAYERGAIPVTFPIPLLVR